VGIEPSPEMRTIARRKGVAATRLLGGDTRHLPFPDRAFDLVCEFSILHHVPDPARVVAEMLRVARRAIFVSDTNNFGRGPAPLRLMKQTLNAVGLWGAADWIKTGGRGYFESEGDGVAYSCSVFNDWAQIRRACSAVHVCNTTGGGKNPYRTAPHVAVLGLKR
jgi:SAM-dependent methyltransferase